MTRSPVGISRCYSVPGDVCVQCMLSVELCCYSLSVCVHVWSVEGCNSRVYSVLW